MKQSNTFNLSKNDYKQASCMQQLNVMTTRMAETPPQAHSCFWDRQILCLNFDFLFNLIMSFIVHMWSTVKLDDAEC